ncbi:hypothetical protein GE674_16140 [Salmonella enterica]|nr:hypothetical protein [Salmonella enterica]
MRDADCNVDNIRIDILQNKGRSGAIGHIIARRTGIIRAIQRNSRRRQPGVDEKFKRLRRRIARSVGDHDG